MAAPNGNQFWKVRSSHGRSPVFKSPDELWNGCEEYFQWVEDHPLEEEKGFAFQGVVTKERFSKMRAMTIRGLCVFLDIGTSTWSDYKSKEDFSDIVTRVEDVIRTQKFEGAAAELLNPNIIAREIGLADKSEFSGPDGSAIEINHGSARERITSRITELSSRNPTK
jgi:hypothetical protein